jgi:hypothetical protein
VLGNKTVFGSNYFALKVCSERRVVFGEACEGMDKVREPCVWCMEENAGVAYPEYEDSRIGKTP